MFSKKELWKIVGLVVLLALVAGCGPTPTPEIMEKVVKETVVVEKKVEVTREVEVVKTARGTGGTLTLLYWQAVSTLNPYLSGGTKDLHAASIVLEPLAHYDETGKLVPCLAKEIPTLENGGISKDLMSITWKLKEGILWSDGAPLTAEDVVFTAEYCLNPDLGCAGIRRFADIKSVEVLDELTVRVNFTKPKPFPYSAFVGEGGLILQKAQFKDCTGAAAQECTKQNFGPIGTGPFKVKDFKANDVAIYEVNENYRDPSKPFFSEVVLKGGGDAASAARAVLETGEADYAWNLLVEPEILQAMELAGNGKIVTSFGTEVERLLVNFTNPDPALGKNRSKWTKEGTYAHPFLTDNAVRRALSLAIDRSVIARIGYGQAGKPTCNILPAPPIYVSMANDECLVQNVELANKILDEAGWLPGPDGIRQKKGVRLSILYQTSTNSVRQGTQALIKQMWQAIGVETELRNIDGAVFFSSEVSSPDTGQKFYADIEMFTDDFAGTDPEAYMSAWQCSKIADESNGWTGGNIARWCNPDYDALVAEMAVTADLEKRAELAKKMNDTLIQNYVLIPLVHRGRVSAHANSLMGVRLNPWDSELWNIADWTRASQ